MRDQESGLCVLCCIRSRLDCAEYVGIAISMTYTRLLILSFLFSMVLDKNSVREVRTQSRRKVYPATLRPQNLHDLDIAHVHAHVRTRAGTPDFVHPCQIPKESRGQFLRIVLALGKIPLLVCLCAATHDFFTCQIVLTWVSLGIFPALWRWLILHEFAGRNSLEGGSVREVRSYWQRNSACRIKVTGMFC